MGDPLDRDPKAIEADLNRGWTRRWVAEEIHGVVARPDGNELRVDLEASEARRGELREKRRSEAVPFKEWWQAERKAVARRENMDPAVLTMWRTSMALSPDYGDELRAFWNLPADFEF